MVAKRPSAPSDADKLIARQSRLLKAPRIAQDYARISEQGRAAGWSLEDYLAAVLAVESNARAESDARLRIRGAGFPGIKTITDFDFPAQPAVDRAQIARLEAGDWLSPSAQHRPSRAARTGKTHLATALAAAAAPTGYRVGFASATAWITRLAEAHRLGQLDAELKKISRIGLIVIDEVGHICFDAEAANLFFQPVSSRYEKCRSL